MTEVQRLLDLASKRQADYSMAFTDVVRGIGSRVSTALGIPVRHDTTMNYRVAQMLEIALSSNGRPTADRINAQATLKVAISSVAPAWAVFAFRRGDRANEWTPTASARLWHGLTVAQRDSLTRVLDDAGLVRVLDVELDTVVSGAFTQLDNVPATVKEVLFCELC